MCRLIVSAIFLSSGLLSLGQSLSLGLLSYPEVAPSKEPQVVITALRPYYDFMDANLQPWHLKVSFQVDDDKGSPVKQGVFEYWWASPKVYRSTWKLGSATHSEWHTADGRSLIQSTGEPLGIYEHWLQATLLSPLPSAADLDPAKSIIVDHSAGAGSHSRCFMVVPAEITEPVARKLRMGTYPEYCVNNVKPLLLGYYRFGNLLMKCLNFSEMQGKTLPREIYILDNSHEVLRARVESVETVTKIDSAFTPAKAAIPMNAETVELNPSVASRFLVKQASTAALEDVKGLQGRVILKTLIGPDGGIEDVRLISSTDPLLALPAFRAVSQREYKPYPVNGIPTAIETTVSIDFPIKN
jgi:hypothetical protein